MLTLARLLLQLVSVTNPGYIPIWQGREPIQYCLAPEVEPYREQVTWAFHQWAAQTGLYSRETRDCAAPRTVAYSMAPLGLERYAAAFYPPPLFPEPRAGDVVLNDAVRWQDSGAPLLLPTLLHETGHALGMGEDPDQAAVMCPWIAPGKLRPLRREISTIRFLYQGEKP